MHITALARKNLTNHMWKAPKVFYCDTDGFAVPAPGGLENTDRLGGLKYEKHIKAGIFAAPKLYAMQSDDDKWDVKSKGFSRIQDDDGKGSHKITYSDFQKLLSHEDLHLEQFARLKTLWRDGQTKPHERTIMKTWVGESRTKRRMQGNSSVPWDVIELQ
jgi:hypothetical protein